MTGLYTILKLGEKKNTFCELREYLSTHFEMQELLIIGWVF